MSRIILWVLIAAGAALATYMAVTMFFQDDIGSTFVAVTVIAGILWTALFFGLLVGVVKRASG